MRFTRVDKSSCFSYLFTRELDNVTIASYWCLLSMANLSIIRWLTGSFRAWISYKFVVQWCFDDRFGVTALQADGDQEKIWEKKSWLNIVWRNVLSTDK